MGEFKYVVVTTDSTRRGVFGGLLVEHDRDKNTVVLEQAQMCVYWSPDMHGVLGLAADGPSSSCRIGKPVPRLELNGITSVTFATADARARWEACPWSS